MDLPTATDLGEAMLGDPQAHGREVKDLPLAPQEWTSLRVNSRWQTRHCLGSAGRVVLL